MDKFDFFLKIYVLLLVKTKGLFICVWKQGTSYFHNNLETSFVGYQMCLHFALALLCCQKDGWFRSKWKNSSWAEVPISML